MKKAFSIMELLVAVALLAVTMTAVGGVFKMSIESQRVAAATSEIMRNLRAITDQINADFKGYRPSPGPAGYFFAMDPGTSTDYTDDLRLDRFIFYANGDFQSTRQYATGSGNETVVGNVARIWYGQSKTPDPNSLEEEDKINKLLLRRMQILTVDGGLTDKRQFDLNFYETDSLEYDFRSLADWRVYLWERWPKPPKDDRGWIDLLTGRPNVDFEGGPGAYVDFIPMVLAKGVDNFAIQLSYWDDGEKKWKWWPTNEDIDNETDYTGGIEAIRFSFTLYDSKGILKGGRTFSHTIYLKDRF